MGILVHDSIDYGNTGTEVVDAYVSFGQSEIRIRKNDTDMLYTISGHGNIWTNATARNANKSSIGGVNITETIDATALSGNLYTVLYTKLKTFYNSTSDV